MNYNFKRVLIAESPMLLQPTVAKVLGINKAIILEQIYYWQFKSTNTLGKNLIGKDGVKRTWIYNTYKDWQKQFSWLSRIRIQQLILEMEKDGYLLSDNFNKFYVDRTKWYSIDVNALCKFLSSRLSKEDIDRINTNRRMAENQSPTEDEDDDEENEEEGEKREYDEEEQEY